MIIGITGGSGCGKTTALDVIQDLGGLILDCDAIYHRLLETSDSLLSAIDARFPGVVCRGKLERKKLGSQVFSDPQALLDLNAIAHGAVKEEVLRLLQPKPKLAAIDAIALFEGNLAELCDHTVVITAPRESRIARLMAREGISREYAESRIDAQKPDHWFSTMADFTLVNNSTRQAFSAEARRLFQSLWDEYQRTLNSHII